MSSVIFLLGFMAVINKGGALKCYKCNFSWKQPNDGLDFTEQFYDSDYHNKDCMANKPPDHLLVTCPSYNSQHFSYCSTVIFSGSIEGIVRDCETITDANMGRIIAGETEGVSPNSCGESTNVATMRGVKQKDCLCNTDRCYGNGKSGPPKIDANGKPISGESRTLKISWTFSLIALFEFIILIFFNPTCVFAN